MKAAKGAHVMPMTCKGAILMKDLGVGYRQGLARDSLPCSPILLLLLLTDSLECVGIVVCVRLVFFVNKGRKKIQ